MGDGSIANPWNLESALRSYRINPGDTLYLRGGTYTGDFDSQLNGEQNNLITIRPYPGEHVIINGRLRVYGRYTRWRGIEFAHLNWNKRQSDQNTLNPTDITGYYKTLEIRGIGTEVINCVQHDLGEGEMWETAVDSVFYGNVIFNNGFNQLSNGGVGHGLYTQNDTGLATIAHNVFVSAYNYGIHAYGSSAANIKNYLIKDNIHMNNTMLIGGLGGSAVDGVTIENNALYNSQMNAGYNALHNKSVVIRNNIIASRLQVFKFDNTVDVYNNTIRTTGEIVGFMYPDPADTTVYNWNNNAYHYLGVGSTPFNNSGQAGSKSFADWKTLTGFDSASTYSTSNPADSIIVKKNTYGEEHLGIVAIYNWTQAATVSVNLGSLGLVNGQSYKLRNAANYLAEWQTFTYNGSNVTITMSGWTVATPVAAASPITTSTFPTFGAFIVTP